MAAPRLLKRNYQADRRLEHVCRCGPADRLIAGLLDASFFKTAVLDKSDSRLTS